MRKRSGENISTSADVRATWKKCSQHGKKLFATRCLDVGRNMLVTSSQHVRHKLVTSLATCTLCQGRREGAQHGKRYSQHEKGVRNMGKGVRNIEKCPQHEKSCSQHSQHVSQHHDPTADMFPNSNRVAEKVSDPTSSSDVLLGGSFSISWHFKAPHPNPG
jgi:hypothetical protein